jgi:hypothetical protein
MSPNDSKSAYYRLFRGSAGLLVPLQLPAIVAERDCETESVFADERFCIGMVLERVKTESNLNALERELDRDYQLLSYLLKHAADLELASIENRMLILDYN